MESALLRARGLGRTFQTPAGPVAALTYVDLDLAARTFVVVRGPSGGGKSTLLNLLGLLDRPTSGSLSLAGEPVERISPAAAAVRRRQDIGFLFQDAGLIERMSLYENVRLPLAYARVRGGEARARTRAAVAAMGLTERLHASVDTLSGGERQRAGLARALITRPRVLICDEPTASLDEANSLAVVERLEQAARDGALVICSSHDPLVIDSADRRLTLDRGRLSADDGLTS